MSSNASRESLPAPQGPPVFQSPAEPAARGRIPTLDWCRGLVMILMAFGHAGMVFNRHREARDGWYLFPDGASLDPWSMGTRFLTHLCAPTFLFLGGVAVAKSYESHLRKGGAEGTFTRDLLIRAGVFLAIDVLWWGVKWMQVLFAFAVGYLLLALARRLPKPVLGAMAVVFLLSSEMVLPLVMQQMGGDEAQLWKWLAGSGQAPWWQVPLVLLVHPGRLVSGALTVQYPALPWTGVFLLGWVCSGWFRRPGCLEEVQRRSRRLFLVGAGLLVGFAALRWANGPGNMYLPRLGDSWTQWLHVSKYPPSLTYTLSQFGLLALLLGVLTRLEWRSVHHGALRWMDLLRVYASAPLFFYCVHAHLLKAAGLLSGAARQSGWGMQCFATAAVLFVMYWLCLWYTRLKAAHPRSLLRYL